MASDTANIIGGLSGIVSGGFGIANAFISAETGGAKMRADAAQQKAAQEAQIIKAQLQEKELEAQRTAEGLGMETENAKATDLVEGWVEPAKGERDNYPLGETAKA
jgi:hypothetical protein